MRISKLELFYTISPYAPTAEKGQMEKPGVSSRHFRPFFPFQLGGSSALEMMWRMAKESMAKESW